MTTTATRTNGYAAPCTDCRNWIPVGAGILTKSPAGKWETRHPAGCPAPTAPSAPAAQPELGYYVRADGAAIKVVASKRVQPDGTRRRYGLVFTPRAGQRPHWLFVKGAGVSVADLRPMTAEDAAGLGLSHGFCIACCAQLGGKTISAACSALIGYGETCAGHNGWRYPKGAKAQRAFVARGGW